MSVAKMVQFPWTVPGLSILKTACWLMSMVSPKGDSSLMQLREIE
jgi:hypothetical protein